MAVISFMIQAPGNHAAIWRQKLAADFPCLVKFWNLWANAAEDKRSSLTLPPRQWRKKVSIIDNLVVVVAVVTVVAVTVAIVFFVVVDFYLFAGRIFVAVARTPLKGSFPFLENWFF